jgi:pimeloyl-ACP methyl ester carboxylesterase
MAGNLHIETAGDPGSPALILLHGGGAASRMWKKQLSGLSGRYRVIAPDLPGFGRSRGPFSPRACADAVVALIGEYRPVHLCGMSLGALVAARVAAEHPASVRRLILQGASIRPAEHGRRAIRFYRSRPGWWYMTASDLADRPALLAMVDAAEQADIRDLLPRITAPTLILCGARDRGCLPDAQPLAAAIVGARLIVVPHTGHGMPLTAARAFNAIVDGFLAAASPTAGH